MWSAICRHFEGVAQRFPDANGVLVNRRTGYADDNAIHIDLANSSNHYIEVLPTGWRLVESPSIDDALPFESSPGARQLPAPEPPTPATLDLLRSTLNLADSVSWLRTLTWLLSAFRPSGPFPILVLRGPAASGKSYAARILRTLVDPNASPFTPTPRSAAQLLHLARHNWVLAFDHVTHLSPAIADALARITSGAGLSFHEDDHAEPTQHWIRRPIILTVTPDCDLPRSLADRALFVDLPALSPESRHPEPILNDLLAPRLPEIFGALCDALSKCLSSSESIPTLTRHSTAVSWAAPAFPEIPAAVDALTPDPFVQSILDLLHHSNPWTGTAPDLLIAVRHAETPIGIGKLLSHHTLSLHDAGISVTRQHKSDIRLIHLSLHPNPPSQPTAIQPDPTPTNGLPKSPPSVSEPRTSSTSTSLLPLRPTSGQ
jgi:hypothetical protein